MDFHLPARIEDYRIRFAAFVAGKILPLEADRANYDAHENIRLDIAAPLRAEARALGLWCPQLQQENGGLGLGRMGMAACYEAMNRSIFGPVIFNAAAPDDGNMMLLEACGTAEQKARWLLPIAQGKLRSAFAMTEPHPGGGSDPGMIMTRAKRRGDRYIVSGRKWFITGAGEAEHFILMARTGEDPRHGLALRPFHMVFALFRFAVVFEGIAARARAGNANAANAMGYAALTGKFAARAIQLIG